jgi:hypothetical protein
MADEPSTTTGGSFAEQLMKKHQEGHNVTLEEVPDEDDPQPAAAPITEPTLSEKAQGKQA